MRQASRCYQLKQTTREKCQTKLTPETRIATNTEHAIISLLQRLKEAIARIEDRDTKGWACDRSEVGNAISSSCLRLEDINKFSNLFNADRPLA